MKKLGWCLISALLCFSCMASTLNNLSEEHQAPVAAPKSITVVLDNDYPPYIFRDAQGQFQGILKDTWALWEARTGVTVNLQAIDWALAQQSIQNGQADVIDTLFFTPERQRHFDFTKPYAILEVPIFFHRSLSGIVNADSLKGFTVGVKAGDACIDVMRQRGIDTLKSYASYSALIAAAETGDIRVFCMDKPPAVYLLNQRGIERDFRQSLALYSGQFHRAVRKGDVATLALLENGFARITKDQYQAIEQKWRGVPIEGHIESPFVRYLAYLLLGIAFIALLMVAWNVTLHRRVLARTAELSSSLADLSRTRKISEESLAQLTATLNALPDLLFEVDIQGVFYSIHVPGGALLFAPAQDSLGKRIVDVLDSQAAAVVMAALLEAHGKGLSTDKQFSTQTPQGIRWYELSIAAKAVPPGEVPRFIVLSRDITVRKNSQQQLDQMVRELNAMLNNNLVGIVKVSNRVVMWANLAFVNMTGYGLDEMVGHSTRLHYTSDEACQALADAAYPLLASGQVYRAQVEFVRKDGTHFWVDLSGAMLDRQDKESLWVFSDVTQSRLADQQLRKLSRITEQAPIAIVITDLRGNIEYVNPSFTQVTGYTSDEVLKTNPRILQSGQTPQTVFDELWQTLLDGHVWTGELQNRKKNGMTFIEHAVIAPVLDADGHATHYVALKQDITRRKQSEQMLLSSLQEKIALLNEVHHRVKNNLQVVTSLLRLEAGRSAQSDTRAVLKDMQGRIYAMALLHETLYRAGNFAFIDLAGYLKQLATQAFRSQVGPGVAVQLVMDIEAARVTLDQATPCGLLVNELLSNALKHGFPEGRSGVVSLQSRPATQPGLWRVTVQDSGIGLPIDFEQRCTQSLGLQLVSDLARQLGGVLEAVPADGGGACFHVTFMLDAPKGLYPS
jgi:PAS domain S-box-containing protein